MTNGEEQKKKKKKMMKKTKEARVWSWGAGTHGQLGTGSTDDSLVPRCVPLLASLGVSYIACGGAHAAAITDNGDVVTWGRGCGGALGHGDTSSSPIPKVVHSLQEKKVCSVAAGWNHTAFIAEDGKIFTCGDGDFGQLGHGDFESSSTPRMVVGLSSQTVSMVACGMRHTLALVKAGGSSSVFAFGSSKRGQLGIVASMGNISLFQPSVRHSAKQCIPHQVEALSGCSISYIAANGDHSAAITDSGSLYLWGKGYNGDPHIFVPTHVAANMFFCQVSLGWSHGLGLSRDGQLLMWGSFKCGQVGQKGLVHEDLKGEPLCMSSGSIDSASDGTVNQKKGFRSHSTDAPGIHDIGNTSKLSSSSSKEQSFDLPCLQNRDNIAADFDFVNRQLKSRSPQLFGVKGLGGIKIVQISVGAEHSALVSDSRMVMTWGWGEHGQLGLGTDDDQGLPHEVEFVGPQDHSRTPSSIQVCCGSGFTFMKEEYSSL